jgi:hypothetical protein
MGHGMNLMDIIGQRAIMPSIMVMIRRHRLERNRNVE